jgi:hypothetical protein
MSKFQALWEYVGKQEQDSFQLTFDEIHQIAGIEIDHSFLTFKKELPAFGYQVGKISLKQQTVQFMKIQS